MTPAQLTLRFSRPIVDLSVPDTVDNFCYDRLPESTGATFVPPTPLQTLDENLSPTPHSPDNQTSSTGFLSKTMESVHLRTDRYASVINLSSATLSESDLSLLSKGLSFCPVPKFIDELKVKSDLQAFLRRLRLKGFFHKKPVTPSAQYDSNAAIFKPKSSFTPPANRDKHLETFIRIVEKEILEQVQSPQPFHRNLTSKEAEALRSFKARRDITLKDADKGSAVVVMDTDRYINEGLRHLSDSTTYRLLNSDPTKMILKELKTLLNRLLNSGVITEDMAMFAIPEDPRPARFYLLPKVHKVGVPGRPVISGCGSLTEKTSALVDWFLKPLLPCVTSYLRDSFDFLAKLKNLGPIPPNSLLVTLDVTALYPSIPHDDGLAALSEFLVLHGFSEPRCKGVTDLARFVLNNNYFEFDDQLYLQTSGTAIGTKMAPSYAVIFMHILESTVAQHSSAPYVWWRFIDDIFCIWTHGEESLLEFIEFVNQLHPAIKFTHEYSPAEINFLDINVKLDAQGIFHTDLYIKPTDTRQFLLASSCHPGHVKRSIPYSQAIRILRICSDHEIAVHRLCELSQVLCQRGHSHKKVKSQIKRAIENFMSGNPTRQTTSDERVPCVLDYHPGLPDINGIFGRFLPVLHCSKTMQDCVPQKPLLSFRRPRNLRNILVRAILPKSESSTEGSCGPCNKPRCQICNILPAQNSIKSTSTSNTFPILCQNADCSSSNCIYVITCTLCQSQYVGQAKTFRLRVNNHKTAVRHAKTDINTECSKLYEHFTTDDHSLQNLSFTIVQVCRKTTDLLKAEQEWIWKMKTVYPSGLNVNDGFSCQLKGSRVR